MRWSLRVWFNGRTGACQASDDGSIPFTRSIYGVVRDMEYGFKKPTLIVETGDGHNVVLPEPLVYVAKNSVTYVMPTGSKSDGASTPKAIWNLIPPFGTYWLGTVLHDGAYRNVLQALNSDGRGRRSR